MNIHHRTIAIPNFTDRSETAAVEQALMAVAGVQHVYVNGATEMAYVGYDPATTDSTQLFTALERAGYEPVPAPPQTPACPKVQRASLLDARRLAIAGAIWLQSLYTLGVLAGFLVPSAVVWEARLIRGHGMNGWAVMLGFIAAPLLGALVGWSFATLRNRLH